jgi:phytoene dehydrogenase-like protein
MHDVIIIGGGHNGLVCAAYLARAGLKVRCWNAAHVVGGAAVTEEFHPGFRNSVASYTVSAAQSEGDRDLRPACSHGLRVVERPYANNFLPLPDGRSFRLGAGRTRMGEVAKFERVATRALPDYEARCWIAIA